MRARRGALVLLVALVAGCSGGGTSTPSPSATPSPTVSPTDSPTPEPTATPSEPATTTASVYFLHGAKLQPAPREVALPGVATGAVRALLLGPARSERATGLSTQVPAGTALRGVSVSAGTATVDLSGSYARGGGSLSMTARVAQVVYTLTQFPTVQRVSFRLDGKPVTALGGEGVDLSRPVTRADYEDLAPDVLVETPRWGEDVGSTVTVTGTADVFEAVFFLEVRDARRRVLVTQRVQASAGTGTRGTFRAVLRLGAVDPGPGTLTSFIRTAKDGSRQDVASLPVRLVG